jgi:hypothetical protein
MSLYFVELCEGKVASCPVKQHALKTYGKARYSSKYAYFRYRVEVTERFHTPAALPFGNEVGIHWIGGWMCPRACLDGAAWSRILAFNGNRTPIFQPVVTVRTE